MARVNIWASVRVRHRVKFRAKVTVRASVSLNVGS